MTRRAVALMAVLTVAVTLSPLEARCQDSADAAQPRGGSLGFHDIDAPIGGRWWLSG